MTDPLIAMQLPNHWLTALFNDDLSGFTDDDESEFIKFSKAMCREYFSWFATDCKDAGFMTYHDARPHGVLACDCSDVQFVVSHHA
tara:strand:- start:71 stop:328 length:258 start_codon:yes stop_codon:yes gene_type:complete